MPNDVGGGPTEIRTASLTPFGVVAVTSALARSAGAVSTPSAATVTAGSDDDHET